VFFALTDEQRALQATVREFLTDRFGLDAVRRGYDDPDDDAHPVELWKSVGEQGWLAVTVPEKYDGLGLGLLDAAVLARCWGEGCVPGPLLPTLLGAEALRLGGTDEIRTAWLPRVAAGEAVLAVSTAPGLSATGDTLTGSVDAVEMAHVADALVLAADGALWLVAASDATVEVAEPLDRTTRLCRVSLSAAPASRLDVAPAAVAARGSVLAANDLAGIAAAALRRTVDYLKTREQFGRPIGSFQALKHAMADLHVATTMAGHSGWYAAHALDAELPDAQLAGHVAKAKCSDTARDVTAAMIQFHGGIGYTWEHDAHFYFKRAKRLEYTFGNADEHREAIARLVVDAD
jgi:alkylation response protein AidB-like acyl-CoA dehydrogenase